MAPKMPHKLRVEKKSWQTKQFVSPLTFSRICPASEVFFYRENHEVLVLELSDATGHSQTLSSGYVTTCILLSKILTR